MARQMANFSRLMDSMVFTTFLMFVSGFGLFLMGELYKNVVQQETKKLSQIAMVVVRLFPFPDKKYEFNLTHVVVFSTLIGMLCMLHHPAQDVIQHELEKTQKNKKKREEAEKKREEAEKRRKKEESKEHK
ncbi:unnamed protein product [Effrenium voratum]|uniref:Uncharacterized protein n=1 Tax=Effrenium voratum TaxID=2562239 RepID=A0AA36JQ43_9DINO|nr:unnamed protein product [Effrenium voratum]CAJ1409141.1 unnamed protein product [Effrenium voratum]|eukprot:CAMPEP_0181431624 /NCGR_PEP_ID=MMETSP1110-20121109/18345_1 /TAXON_ID=174948 /ORGANISM="Symbiodinium sp., Strain CCMP421" /LENGTH=130 /DNA_ID=CAMNT_0023554997 /DNA_START=33 /DNA_END=425 /DNA_ORIENTATION=-